MFTSFFLKPLNQIKWNFRMTSYIDQILFWKLFDETCSYTFYRIISFMCAFLCSFPTTPSHKFVNKFVNSTGFLLCILLIFQATRKNSSRKRRDWETEKIVVEEETNANNDKELQGQFFEARQWKNVSYKMNVLLFLQNLNRWHVQYEQPAVSLFEKNSLLLK